MPYASTIFPLMLSASKHERPLFQRAALRVQPYLTCSISLIRQLLSKNDGSGL